MSLMDITSKKNVCHLLGSFYMANSSYNAIGQLFFTATCSYLLTRENAITSISYGTPIWDSKSRFGVYSLYKFDNSSTLSNVSKSKFIELTQTWSYP